MASDGNKRKELLSLHYLRALAVILITYDHLVPGLYLETTGEMPVTFIERYILWPFGIINHFGFYGVVIFFLISGYLGLYTFRPDRTRLGSFCLKRLFRILPPVLFSIIAYYALALFGRLLFPVSHAAIPGYAAVNQALWTLNIEVLFYLLFACLMPLFRRDGSLGLLAAAAVVAAVCEAGIHVPALARFGDRCSYLFYVLMGCCVFLFQEGDPKPHRRLLRPLLALLLWYCVIHYNIVIYNPARYDPGNSFGVSALYALLTFLVFLAGERRLRESRFISAVSRGSYSAYLNQVPMRALCAGLYPLLPVPVLALFSTLLTLLLSWADTGWFEGLFARLQEKLTGGKRLEKH